MTSVYNLAEEFVELTGCSVFLTGKAGTGKTTFLRQIREQTHKQIAVVAPTGVAAINAGGVTIHSFFQLPFTPFVPTSEGATNLISKQHVTSVRRKIFQELELLVIDEISMVRADTLDAIDTILRHYRYRRNEPFGGVQVIFIGDMYQLSPVCVGEEWALLSQFYESPYFFHSRVILQRMPIYIELDHIFRQTNQQFITLLNEVRNNHLSDNGFRLLNLRYHPNFHPKDEDGYITLTTHNRRADSINAAEMAKITNPVFSYIAEIKGDFSEKNYPNDELLNLKVGAKVMFIANDAGVDRKYYNGKIGVIAELSEEEIFVVCDGETESIAVSKETWENIHYGINKETNQIEETVLGSYTQYPLRLAWAITIHKSQGLTFDKVVIDAGSAFASGQVYVALSRCRSLDGIVLTTPISERSLAVDDYILAFANMKPAENELFRQVQLFKSQYSTQILNTVFNFSLIAGLVRSFVDYIGSVITDFNEETQLFLDTLLTDVYDMATVANKFLHQLNGLYSSNDVSKLQERIQAASDYFTDKLSESMLLVENSPAVTDSFTQATDYKERLENIYGVLAEKRHILHGIRSDFSVSRFFQVKSEFEMPKIRISAYSGEKSSKKKSLVKVEHADLYEQLVDLRNLSCRERSLLVYMVADTKMLAEVSNRLPKSVEELSAIKGFGKIKTQRYGPLFLEVVVRYCKENGLEMGIQSGIDFDQKKDNVTSKPKAKKGETLKITLEMCRLGKSIDEIAVERQLVVGTIEGHVTKLIEQGELSVYDYVPKTEVEELTTLIGNKSTTISDVMEQTDGKYGYSQIRFVMAYLQNQHLQEI
jgi:hypothetical protein